MTLAVEDVNTKSDDVVEVHKYTLFLCSLDVGNIDDQCRGSSIKERDHLAELPTHINYDILVISLNIYLCHLIMTKCHQLLT